MALIIKGDMPKGCGWDCDLWSEGLCAPLQKSVDEHTIDSDCPIIGEIPDSHGDLIDRGLVQEVLAQLLPLVITNELTDKEIGLVNRTVGAIAEMINEQEVVLEATE